MAIVCAEPNTIGEQAEAMQSVISGEGKSLLNEFKGIITNLDSHWKGTDAVANLTDLANVYEAMTNLMKGLDKIIVTVNNGSVLPLQKMLNASGGSCKVGNELAETMSDVDSTVSFTKEVTETRTEDAILEDAEQFSSFPTKFDSFLENLGAAKNTLTANWTSGADLESFETVWNEFNNSKDEYKALVSKVQQNISIVAENKKQLL